MQTYELWRYGKSGLSTLFSSVIFFYSHFSLLIIALIPACIRVYQMWNELQTPFWLEVIVEITRIILFLVMISFMAQENLNNMRNKHFWKKLATSCSLHVKEHWPNVFLAQIAIFLIFLYALGNLAITIVVDQTLLPIANMLDITLAEHSIQAAHQAYLFFLKNMSIIPLTMVYMLYMFGVKKHDLR